MVKNKLKKSISETVVMQLRLPSDLRESFNLSCRNKDQTSSQVIRAYMREYIAQNSQQKFVRKEREGEQK